MRLTLPEIAARLATGFLQLAAPKVIEPAIRAELAPPKTSTRVT